MLIIHAQGKGIKLRVCNGWRPGVQKIACQTKSPPHQWMSVGAIECLKTSLKATSQIINDVKYLDEMSNNINI